MNNYNNLLRSETLEELEMLMDECEPEYDRQALYAVANGLDTLNFDSWVHLEKLLGQHLSYEHYLWVDQHCDAMLLEYGEEDVPKLLAILNAYNQEAKNFEALIKAFGEHNALWNCRVITNDFPEFAVLGYELTFSDPTVTAIIYRLLQSRVGRTPCGPVTLTATCYSIILSWPQELWLP